MLVNFISSIVYIIYNIYNNFYKIDMIETLFKTDLNLSEPNNSLETYKKIKRKHITVYIVGVLIGLIILVLFGDSSDLSNSSKTVNIGNKQMHVSDIDDIYVK